MPQVDVVNLMVWTQLKSYLPPGTTLNSVYRSPQDQLDYIVRKAKEYGYTYTKKPTLSDRSSWQAAPEFIRKGTAKYKGIKVAAPGRSMHGRGIAYDLGGDLKKIEAAVRRAVADGRIKLSGSKDALLIEPNNGPRGCVHVEIVEAVIHNDSFDYFSTA
jgi:hypothetical protein